MTQFSVSVVGDLRTLGANTWCASCVCTVEVKRHPKMQGLHTTSVLLLGQTFIFLYLQEPSHIATDMRNITWAKDVVEVMFLLVLVETNGEKYNHQKKKSFGNQNFHPPTHEPTPPISYLPKKKLIFC